MTWTAVVAASRNNVIGLNGDLPWKLRSDLKRFKSLTMGHCLLMGRKTMESIGRTLPGRQTIVLSRTNFQAPEGVSVVDSLDKVSGCVDVGRDVMVVGGAQIYAATLASCTRLWLTRVLAEIPGDTFLPAINFDDWTCESVESIPCGEHDQFPSEFQTWNRK